MPPQRTAPRPPAEPAPAVGPRGLAWLLCLASLPALAQPADSRGRLLYETHCTACHSTQIHWRDARQARDWAGLYRQVELWQARTGQRWSDEDIAAVAGHLNATIYHFPVPGSRAGLGNPMTHPGRATSAARSLETSP